MWRYIYVDKEKHYNPANKRNQVIVLLYPTDKANTILESVVFSQVEYLHQYNETTEIELSSKLSQFWGHP